MTEQPSDGCSGCLLDIIDDGNPVILVMEIDLSLPTARVAHPLAQIIEWHGKPVAMHSDNGLESVSKALRNVAVKNNIEFPYIQPGNPQQNAYVERYHRTVGNELLGQPLFDSLKQI